MFILSGFFVFSPVVILKEKQQLDNESVYKVKTNT